MINKKATVLLSLLLLGLPLFAFSREIIAYPDIPGATAIGEETTFPEYIEYLYYATVAITGVIALGIFVWGGLIYLTSAGSPGRMREGRQKIFSGLGGIAIILGAHIFLTTINPQLLGLEPTEVSLPEKGYCLRGDLFEWKGGDVCPEGWTVEEDNKCQDFVGLTPESATVETCCRGNNKRIYCFDRNLLKISPTGFAPEEICFREDLRGILAYRFFSEETFQGDSDGDINSNVGIGEECSWQKPRNHDKTKSVYIFKWAPGFQLFPSESERCWHDFQDYPKNMGLHVRGTTPDIGDYNHRIVSIGVQPDFSKVPVKTSENGESYFDVDSYSPGYSWSAIFFSQTENVGKCGIIHHYSSQLINLGCYAANQNKAGGAFLPMQVPGGIGLSSGDGKIENIASVSAFQRSLRNLDSGRVIFYSDIDHDVGDESPKPHKIVDFAEINQANRPHTIWKKNLTYDPLNEWGMQHIYSVKIEGNFVVVLNSEPDFTGDCMVLRQSRSNLFDSFVLRAWRTGARVRSIAIMPAI
jgi:hypothetical protein